MLAMLRRKYLLYIFIVIIIHTYSIVFSFNLEELKWTNYEVDILQTPVKWEEEQSQSVIHMTSKYGQNYQCILPQIEDEDVSEKDAANEKPTDIKELLKPMQTGSCLSKSKDWWTYEFCVGQYIKQFHIEDGNIKGQVITLGLYDYDYDWDNETDLEKFKHVKQRYHSQYYKNGSKCDLTGQPREAEVRIYCEEDAVDYIYRVDEPGTCSYLITVHTSRLCSHPKLKPLPSNKAHSIACSPLLNEKQYAEYLQKLNEEKTLAEEKRNQWLNNQQERLQVMKNWANDNFLQIESEEIEKLTDSTDEKELEDNSIVIAKQDEISDDSDKPTETILSDSMESDKITSKEEDSEEVIEKILLREFKETNDAKIEDKDSSENDIGKLDEQSEGNLKVIDDDESRSAVLDDDKLHVRIRRLDRKSVDSSGKLHEMDFTQRKKLEQAVKEKLEKAGLDTGGRRIEVKIITAGYYDNEDGKDFHALSDEETNQFQNMIMALLTGQQEAVQEMERQKKLEENYKFIWGNEQNKEDEDDS